ncbi:hypothetical protein ACSBR1_040548 [Camellia fascicularis]
MANNKHEVRKDDIHNEEEEHVEPNAREENRNEGSQEPNLGANDVGKGHNGPKKGGQHEYYNESNLQVWKDRCLRRDKEMTDMANKLIDL